MILVLPGKVEYWEKWYNEQLSRCCVLALKHANKAHSSVFS